MKHKGLDNQNYPVFLELLLHQNEHVINALLEDGKVFGSFKKLQRTHYLIHVCFELLRRFTPGGVYDQTLETILTVLYLHFHHAPVGYKLYPPVFEELNNVGKYLDQANDQSERINRIILDILADIWRVKFERYQRS